MKNFAFLALAAFGLPLFAQNTPPPKTTLKVGDTAPDFSIPARSNTSGKDIKLSDFQGKKNVILAFFPAAFTGG
jgi:peroxiredoxin